MVSQTGPGTEDQCRALLRAAVNGDATRDDVAAIFVARSDADIDTAANQLSLAGLLAM
jgi:plasmid stability protein